MPVRFTSQPRQETAVTPLSPTEKGPDYTGRNQADRPAGRDSAISDGTIAISRHRNPTGYLQFPHEESNPVPLVKSQVLIPKALEEWNLRKVRDSNPRYESTPYSPLAGERLQPLSQLSKWAR